MIWDLLDCQDFLIGYDVFIGLWGLRRGLEMILRHVALSSLTMSQYYGAIGTHSDKFYDCL